MPNATDKYMYSNPAYLSSYNLDTVQSNLAKDKEAMLAAQQELNKANADKIATSTSSTVGVQVLAANQLDKELPFNSFTQIPPDTLMNLLLKSKVGTEQAKGSVDFMSAFQKRLGETTAETTLKMGTDKTILFMPVVKGDEAVKPFPELDESLRPNLVTRYDSSTPRIGSGFEVPPEFRHSTAGQVTPEIDKSPFRTLLAVDDIKKEALISLYRRSKNAFLQTNANKEFASPEAFAASVSDAELALELAHIADSQMIMKRVNALQMSGRPTGARLNEYGVYSSEYYKPLKDMSLGATALEAGIDIADAVASTIAFGLFPGTQALTLGAKGKNALSIFLKGTTPGVLLGKETTLIATEAMMNEAKNTILKQVGKDIAFNLGFTEAAKALAPTDYNAAVKLLGPIGVMGLASVSFGAAKGLTKSLLAQGALSRESVQELIAGTYKGQLLQRISWVMAEADKEFIAGVKGAKSSTQQWSELIEAFKTDGNSPLRQWMATANQKYNRRTMTDVFDIPTDEGLVSTLFKNMVDHIESPNSEAGKRASYLLNLNNMPEKVVDDITSRFGISVWRNQQLGPGVLGGFAPAPRELQLNDAAIKAFKRNPKNTMDHELRHAADSITGLTHKLLGSLVTDPKIVKGKLSFGEPTELFAFLDDYVRNMGRLGYERHSTTMLGGGLGRAIDMNGQWTVEIGEALIDLTLRNDETFKMMFPEVHQYVKTSGVVDIYRQAFAKLDLLDTLATTDLAEMSKSLEIFTRGYSSGILFEGLTKRQAMVDGLVHLKLDLRNNTFDASKVNGFTTPGGMNGLYASFLDMARTPSKMMTKIDKEFVKRIQWATQQRGVNSTDYKRIVDKINTGLSKDELNNLDEILTTQSTYDSKFIMDSATGELYHPSTTLRTNNPKIIDAYFAHNQLLTHGRYLLDDSFKQVLKQQGVVSLRSDPQIFLKEVTDSGKRSFTDVPIKQTSFIGGKTVTTEIQGAKVNKADLNNGWKVYEEIDLSNNQQALGKYHMFSPEAHEAAVDVNMRASTVVGHLEGYIPRYYEDPFIVQKLERYVMNPQEVAKGAEAIYGVRIMEKFTVPTYRDFQKLRQSTLPVDHEWVAFRTGQLDSTKLATVTPYETVQFWNSLRTDSKKAIIEGLNKSGEYETAAYFNALQDIRTPKTVHAMTRGEKLQRAIIDTSGKIVRTADAPLLPTYESIQRYMTTVSRYADRAPVFHEGKTKFLNTYGHLLADSSDWRSRLKTIDEMTAQVTKEAAGSLPTKGENNLARLIELETNRLREAKVAQNYLMDFQGLHIYRNDTVNRFATWLQTTGNKIVREKGQSVVNDLDFQAVNKLYDQVAEKILLPFFDIRGQAAFARGVTTHAFLGAMHIGQAIIQTSDILKLSLYMDHENAEHVVNGVANFMQVLMAKRGPAMFGLSPSKTATYLDDVLRNSGFAHGINWDNASYVAGGMQGSKLLGAMGAISTAPFQFGEQFARSSIWFVERERAIAEVLSGTAKGELAKLTKLDIDGKVFLQEVNNRATKLAFDFSNIDQPALFKMGGGLMALPLQFKQYTMKMTGLMIGDDLNLRQKIMLGTTYGFMFGTSGLPFVNDIMNSAGFMISHLDNDSTWMDFKTKFADSLTKNKMARNTIKEGWLYAASEGMVHLANRMAIGSVIDTFLSQKKWQDYLGPGVKTMVDLTMGVGDVLSTMGRGGFNLATGEKFNYHQDMAPSIIVMKSMIEGKPIPIPALREATSSVASFSAAAKAYEMRKTGYLRNTRGEIILDHPRNFEIFLQALSIQPGRVVDAYKASRTLNDRIAFEKTVVQEAAKATAQLQSEGQYEYAKWKMQNDLQTLGEHQKFMLFESYFNTYFKDMDSRNMSPTMREFNQKSKALGITTDVFEKE